MLANEQVVDGRGWRTGRSSRSASSRSGSCGITAYAEELLGRLTAWPGWPESVRAMQRNWIGRSEGREIDFEARGRRTLRVSSRRAPTPCSA